MTPQRNAHKLLTFVLGLVILGLAGASALPHAHDHTTLSHQAEACRVCKLHEGFAAATGLAQLPVFTAAALVVGTVFSAHVPLPRRLIRRFSSRAPPLLA